MTVSDCGKEERGRHPRPCFGVLTVAVRPVRLTHHRVDTLSSCHVHWGLHIGAHLRLTPRLALPFLPSPEDLPDPGIEPGSSAL